MKDKMLEKVINYTEILVQRMLAIIQNEYILLGLPYYGNVGDQLIWEATLQMLKRIPYRCLYSSNDTTYSKPKIGDETVILFLGGGNFGDIWYEHQQFRYKVMEDFPRNPIVQLPQSVWFENQENLERDIAAFAQHKGEVTICLREEQSFQFVSKHYPMVKAMLIPDMVLGLDIEKVLKNNRLQNISGEGTLYVKRTDKEYTDSPLMIQAAHIADWPTIGYYCTAWHKRTDRMLDQMEQWHCSAATLQRTTQFMWRHFVKDSIIRNGIRFLIPYRTIYTNRLHAAILAALLGKEVVMMDNSYGKCSSVYNTWLSDWTNIKFIQ